MACGNACLNVTKLGALKLVLELNFNKHILIQYISNHFTNVSVKTYTIISVCCLLPMQLYTDDGISFAETLVK